jgi:ABC-type nickel/cobalt efflux system permease component RcnA
MNPSSVEWLAAWYNLVYLVPFFLALLYLVLYALSGITFGEDLAAEGHDLEHDAAVDHDLDHDAVVDHDADHDASAEHDYDHDADPDADAGHDAKSGAAPHQADHVGHESSEARAKVEGKYLIRALSWLGIGRVPFSILLMVLCFSWGFIGFAINNLLVTLPLFGSFPPLVALVSLPVAFLGSTTLTRTTARTLGKWLPSTATSARSRGELVGSVGEAVLFINGEFGQAAVRDADGNLHQVSCRTYDDAKPLAKGTRVLLVDYSEDDGSFWVIESDL